MLSFILSLYICILTLTVSIDGHSSSSCRLLRTPMEILKCKVEDLLKRNHQLKLSLEQTKTSDTIQNEVLAKISKNYPCSHNACGPCACNTDYQLDKKYYCNCEHLEPMRDCLAFRNAGYNISGLYVINMKNLKTAEVFCDQETDKGGWTVFQRRLNGKTEFNRDWLSYKEGFGNPQREFWLGNENIYLLTYQAEYPRGSELRIDMEDWSRKKIFAKYSTFLLGSEEEKYRLFVKGFSGDAGDSMAYSNKHFFSTYDADNDADGRHCAKTYLSAWWFKACFYSALNGKYRLWDETFPAHGGVMWYTYKGASYSMKFTEMKVRRKE